MSDIPYAIPEADAAARAGAAPPQRNKRAGLSSRQLRSISVTVLTTICLTLLTIGTFNYLPRHELPGRAILGNADFRAGFQGWQMAGLVTLAETELGRAILQNYDPAKLVYLRRIVDLPPGQTSLMVRADVATSRIQRGELPWHMARIYLVQQAADGTLLWHQRHHVASLVGTTARQSFSEIFEVPGSISRVMLGIELAHATGRMDIADLQLAIVEERPLFRLAAAALVCAWALLGFRVASRLYRSIPSPAVRGWLLLAGSLLLVGVLMPSAPRQHLIDGMASSFGLGLGDPHAAAHAALFGLLAMLVRLGRPRDPLLLHLSCWLLVGAVSEVLQLLTAERTPQAGDWLVDALAATSGLAAAEVGLRLQRILEPPPPPPPPPA